MLSEVTSFPLPDSLPPSTFGIYLSAGADGWGGNHLARNPLWETTRCVCFSVHRRQRVETALINMFFSARATLGASQGPLVGSFVDR